MDGYSELVEGVCN